MALHDIFSKLSDRMVGAMMVHTQLTELFDFIDLKSDAKRQKKQFHWTKLLMSALAKSLSVSFPK